MALSDLALKRLKADPNQPMNKIKRVSDGNGLQAWVRHTGTISWGVVYRWNGQKQEMTIGKYPYMSLSMARAENIRIRELLAQGINPKDERKQAKDKQKQRTSFDYFANLWLDSQKKPTTTQNIFKRAKPVFVSYQAHHRGYGHSTDNHWRYYAN